MRSHLTATNAALHHGTRLFDAPAGCINPCCACLPQEVFLTEQHLCLVMDLADGGDLSSTIDRLRVQGVRNLSLDC